MALNHAEKFEHGRKEFEYHWKDYGPKLAEVNAPIWLTKGIHPTTGPYITFLGDSFVAEGLTFEECLEHALEHFTKKNGRERDHFINVTSLGTDAIVDIATYAEKFSYIPHGEMQRILLAKRDASLLAQFQNGGLQESAPVDAYERTLAEAIRQENYECARKLFDILQAKKT